MTAIPTAREVPGSLFDFSAAEHSLLRRLDVERRLANATTDPDGLQAFAQAFQFVRQDFPMHNFIVGSRCPPHEAYWGGLARNIWEELGGGLGATHNELFRRFFRSTGLIDERAIPEPVFAAEYNAAWTNYARTAPLLEALAAIGVFESYDEPDYGMFVRALGRERGRECDLTFFRVHANAHHAEFFNCLEQHESRVVLEAAVSSAAAFVASTQEKLWHGLLAQLER